MPTLKEGLTVERPGEAGCLEGPVGRQNTRDRQYVTMS